MMRSSLTLGSYRGIQVGLHWSIAVVGFLVVTTLSGSVLPSAAPGYSGGAYLLGAVVIGTLFFASIVAHEFGHSIIAQRNDVQVSHITLFALGGVAALESEPRTPGAAARIALAGPAVSLMLAASTVAVAIGVHALGASALLVGGLVWLGAINGGLAVFNMLPALPLDGGRALQAWMWRRKGDPLLATISAARLGGWIGWSLVAFGMWQFFEGGQGLFTAIIGWFIVGSAKAESLRASMQLGQAQWQRQFDAWTGHGAPPFDPSGSPFDSPRPPGSSRSEVVDVDEVHLDEVDLDEVDRAAADGRGR